MKVFLLLLVALCVGAASAESISAPSRALLSSQLGYIPSGCPLTVSVSAEESQPSWFQDAPEIRGSVTLSNPTSYDVPIRNIIVQARSSDGMLYSALAYCDGNGSPTVPYNPVPYTYGTVTCRYRLVLDRNVFGSYGQSGNRKLLSGGQVQANFFPGSSSSGSGSGGGSGSSSGVGYFPPPSQRASWTVTAIVTVQYSNAQCLSAPTPVNTDCWWNWLASWHQQHHHKFSWLFGGRKLLMNLFGGSNAQVESKQTSSDSTVSRTLLHSHSEHSGNSGSEHRHHNHHHHNSGSFSGSGDSGRSLLHSDSEHSSNSGSEHREHRHHNHHHHNSGSFSSSGDSSRSLLHSHSEHSSNSGSEHREHRHHNHHNHNSGSGDSGRSLLHSHSEHFGNSGSKHTEHRHHHHSSSSSSNSGSFSGSGDSV